MRRRKVSAHVLVAVWSLLSHVVWCVAASSKSADRALGSDDDDSDVDREVLDDGEEDVMDAPYVYVSVLLTNREPRQACAQPAVHGTPMSSFTLEMISLWRCCGRREDSPYSADGMA